MGLEIERKFLVNEEEWKKVGKSEKQFLRQGYLVTDPDKTIRVRETETQGFLTIKGRSIGATRLEFEYEIPKKEAEQLLNDFSISDISKVRYTIMFKEKIWEVDEFLGDNVGLIIAEIELESEDEKFDLPDWVAHEVTGEEKYYNSNLSISPFKNWSNLI